MGKIVEKYKVNASVAHNSHLYFIVGSENIFVDYSIDDNKIIRIQKLPKECCNTYYGLLLADDKYIFFIPRSGLFKLIKYDIDSRDYQILGNTSKKWNGHNYIFTAQLVDKKIYAFPGYGNAVIVVDTEKMSFEEVSFKSKSKQAHFCGHVSELNNCLIFSVMHPDEFDNKIAKFDINANALYFDMSDDHEIGYANGIVHEKNFVGMDRCGNIEIYNLTEGKYQNIFSDYCIEDKGYRFLMVDEEYYYAFSILTNVVYVYDKYKMEKSICKIETPEQSFVLYYDGYFFVFGENVVKKYKYLQGELKKISEFEFGEEVYISKTIAMEGASIESEDLNLKNYILILRKN